MTRPYTVLLSTGERRKMEHAGGEFTNQDCQNSCNVQWPKESAWRRFSNVISRKEINLKTKKQNKYCQRTPRRMYFIQYFQKKGQKPQNKIKENLDAKKKRKKDVFLLVVLYLWTDIAIKRTTWMPTINASNWGFKQPFSWRIIFQCKRNTKKRRDDTNKESTIEKDQRYSWMKRRFNEKTGR